MPDDGSFRLRYDDAVPLPGVRLCSSLLGLAFPLSVSVGPKRSVRVAGCVIERSSPAGILLRVIAQIAYIFTAGDPQPLIRPQPEGPCVSCVSECESSECMHACGSGASDCMLRLDHLTSTVTRGETAYMGEE